MLYTSKEWNECFKTDELFPETDIKILSAFFENIPEFAISKSVFNDKLDISHSDILQSEFQDFESTKFATFEHNFWILDGSFEILDDTDEQMQYVQQYLSNELSDDNGYFENPITFEFEFPDHFNIPDYVTMKFDTDTNERPTRIEMLNDTVPTAPVLTTLDIDENKYYHYIPFPKGPLNKKLIISIPSWSMPRRRARVSALFFGTRLCFDKNNLSSFEHQKTCDMVNAELPQNTCTFGVMDIEKYFDPFNENSLIYNMSLSGKKFIIYYKVKINNKWEELLCDTVLLSKIERKSNDIVTNFTLESLFVGETGKFAESKNPLDEWTNYFDILSVIRRYLMKFDNIYANTVPHSLRENIHSKLSLVLQAIDDNYYKREMREWLQLVASALFSIIICKADGTIELKCLVNDNGELNAIEPVDIIPLYNCFNYPELEKIDSISEIQLTTAHGSDAKTDSNYSIKFDEYIGTVEFLPYVLSKKYPEGNSIQTAQNDILVFTKSSSYGVTANEVQYKAYPQFLYDMISESIKITVECMINPAWEMGDVIYIETKSGDMIPGFLTGIDLKYAGSFKGTVTLLSIYGFRH